MDWRSTLKIIQKSIVMHYGFNNKKVPRYIDGEQLSEPEKKEI